ncbi:MAG: hypothetical protein QOD06_1662 [Candidatus Binatota bacterium]|jgi:UPF0755 protein|nr:hypothetical protein [Candidatus Binatota bacterium]
MRRLLVASLLGFLLAGAALWAAVHLLLQRPGPPLAEPVRIDVGPGEPFRVTARNLEDRGLVPSGRALALWARLFGADRDIKSGSYLFPEPLRPIDLLEKMRSGEVMVMRATLIEGMTARAFAAALEAAGVGPAAEYVRLIDDPSFARALGVPASSLEGYLYPDTYFFSPAADPRRVLRTLVARFQQVVGPEIRDRATKRGFSLHEVVTLASVVEKETGRADERPLVAAVFLNRLERHMPLQSDPTVIYGIEGFDGNLRRSDLQTPGPYNTYLAGGLPAGPIANPSLASIEAVLNPADVPYIYFVARGDGSHEFTSNLADHNRAVDRYQRRR